MPTWWIAATRVARIAIVGLDSSALGPAMISIGRPFSLADPAFAKLLMTINRNWQSGTCLRNCGIIGVVWTKLLFYV